MMARQVPVDLGCLFNFMINRNFFHCQPSALLIFAHISVRLRPEHNSPNQLRILLITTRLIYTDSPRPRAKGSKGFKATKGSSMSSLTQRLFRSREPRETSSTPAAVPDSILAVESPTTRPAILQLMGSLGLNRGGLTRSVYERTMELSTGRRVVIASLAHQLNYPEVFEAIIEAGQLPRHSELRDFHSDLQQNGRIGTPEETKLAKLLSAGAGIDSTIEQGNDSVFERFFFNGTFIGMQCKTTNGALKYSDHHDPNRPWIVDFRDRYDNNGRVRVREYMNEDFKPRYKIFYNETGGEYLAYWMSPTGYEYRAIRFDSTSSHQFKDLRALHSNWIRHLSDELGQSILFSDEPTTAFALSLELPQSKKVGAIHTTHYANHVDATDGLKGWVPHYQKAFGTIDRLVFFTKTQQQDFQKDTNCPENILITVPHAAPKIQIDAHQMQTEKELNLFVIVSRLDKDKRIDKALEAFARAFASQPEVRLEIYGTGPEEKSLISLSKALGLSQQISFKGYTSFPLKAFAPASVSIMTSRYEGFGLVITESMACGTPVISFDVKYGPHELIEDGVNGRLVSDGDIDQLAAAMVESISNQAIQSARMQGAIDTANRYSLEKWKSNWNSLAKSLD